MNENKHDIFKIVGCNIKNMRNKKRITLDELSSKTGLRKEYLKKIEEGKAYGLTTTKFFRIAEGLNTLPHLLLKNL